MMRQKMMDSLAAPLPTFTRRDVRVPGVPGKAVAAIGLRRTGWERPTLRAQERLTATNDGSK